MILEKAPIPSIRPRARLLGATAVAAGAAMAMAGLLHLSLAPAHAGHSFEHALALYTTGVAEVAWTAVWLQRPSRFVGSAGVAIAAATLFLYALSRVLPLPFEGEPEPVDGIGLVTQLCEAVAFVSLVALAVTRGTAVRRTAVWIGSAVAGASVFFAAASIASLASGSGP